MPPNKLLILGGTQEGAALAQTIDLEQWEVCISYSGITGHQPDLPCRVHVGGFGGAKGLRNFIKAEGFTHLIDATHPYAHTISNNAWEAVRASSIKAIRYDRPAWVADALDQWVCVSSPQEAADEVGKRGQKVFLTIGMKELDAFKPLSGVEKVVRTVTPIDASQFTQIVDRGPFSLEDELALFETEKIKLLVSKNSGGTQTYAKIEAARKLGLPVIMIERPAPSDLPTCTSLDDVRTWLSTVLLKRETQPRP